MRVNQMSICVFSRTDLLTVKFLTRSKMKGAILALAFGAFAAVHASEDE